MIATRLGGRKNSVASIILFMLIGSLFLIVGGLMLSNGLDLAENGLSAEATIVNLVRNASGKSTTYSPEIEFTIASGETIRLVYHSRSNSPKYSAGQKINILYSQDNPRETLIDSAFGIYLFPMIFISVGAIMLLIDSGLIIRRIR